MDEATIRGIVADAERSGVPAQLATDLEAQLTEVMLWLRRRMERINRHSQILSVLEECGYSVTLAATELEMTREGIYKHIRTERKSTDSPIGVDAQAA